MGICSSCLGGGRHSRRRSQDEDLDQILAGGNRSRRSRRGGGRNYGTLSSTEDDDDDDDHTDGRSSSSVAAAAMDEEELRRQRLALQSITAQAAENMIDVLQSRHSETSFGVRHKQVSVRSLREHHREHLRRGREVAAEDVVAEAGEGEERQKRKSTQSAKGSPADEAAWLESVRAADADVIHMPSRRSRLVLDVNLKDGARSRG